MRKCTIKCRLTGHVCCIDCTLAGDKLCEFVKETRLHCGLAVQIGFCSITAEEYNHASVILSLEQ